MGKFKCFLLAVIFAASISGCTTTTQQGVEPWIGSNESKKESFYKQLSRIVIRLERNSGKPIGTAFFSTYDGDKNYYYLITARHLVFPPRDTRARVSTRHKDTGDTEVIELRIPMDQWIFHPQSNAQIEFRGKVEKLKPVDVAVAKIPKIKDHSVRTISYCPLNCIENKTKNQFYDKTPEPPMRVMVWGFPGNFDVELEEPRPMGRLGLIAMKAKEPFTRTKGMLHDANVYLIDVTVFPGNSGSPVFSYPAFGKIKLVGLTSAAALVRRYAIAEPVSRIIETMDVAFKSDREITASWHSIKNTP